MLLLNLVLTKSIYITVITQNFDTGLKTKHTHFKPLILLSCSYVR